jgi:hypothetical protein
MAGQLRLLQKFFHTPQSVTPLFLQLRSGAYPISGRI